MTLGVSAHKKTGSTVLMDENKPYEMGCVYARYAKDQVTHNYGIWETVKLDDILYWMNNLLPHGVLAVLFSRTPL